MDNTLTVELKALNQPTPTASTIAEMGMFTLEDVPEGEYELLLYGEGIKILLRELNV